MQLIEQDLTGQILNAFYDTYNALGYGFLESPYANALVLELEAKGLAVRREVPVELFHRNKKIGFYRIDLLVNDKVIVELKSSECLAESDRRQLLNYLRAAKVNVGLLLHFGLSPSFKRVVWNGNRFVVDPALSGKPASSA